MLNSGNVDLAMDIALVQSDEGETLVVLGDSEHWCETVGKTPKNTKGKFRCYHIVRYSKPTK